MEDHELTNIALEGFDKKEDSPVKKIGSTRMSGNSTNSSVQKKPTPKEN